MLVCFSVAVVFVCCHTMDPHNGKAVASSAIATEIVKNFESLVRKSSRLFGSLRDLPQFGKYWSNHFQKTFEVYTKVCIVKICTVNHTSSWLQGYVMGF